MSQITFNVCRGDASTEAGVKKFSASVEKMLAEGWLFHGGMHVVYDKFNGRLVSFQAMAKGNLSASQENPLEGVQS